MNNGDVCLVNERNDRAGKTSEPKNYGKGSIDFQIDFTILKMFFCNLADRDHLPHAGKV